MEKTAPTLHYIFEHRMLRNLVLNDTQAFNLIASIGPATMVGFLRGFWYDISNRFGELRQREITLANEDFGVSMTKLNNEQRLLLIKSPNPIEPTETYYVGIIIETGRYFTLELGYDDLSKKEYYVVGEWTKEEKHVNYGEVSEPKPDLFAGRVEEVIGKNN